MNWTIRRSDENPEKFQNLKILLAVCTVLSLVAAISTSMFLPLLGLIVVFGSTSEFFLGKKYLLNESMAKAGAAEISWPLVKSVHIEEKMIYLSPFESESKLDAFRGVKLIIQNVSKENVLEYVQNHVGKDVRFLGE